MAPGQNSKSRQNFFLHLISGLDLLFLHCVFLPLPVRCGITRYDSRTNYLASSGSLGLCGEHPLPPSSYGPEKRPRIFECVLQNEVVSAFWW